jgi:hypothetical protein
MRLKAGHYHFAPKPCAPYRGNEKGTVERTIQYLRHGFFAARRFPRAQGPRRSRRPARACRARGRAAATARAPRAPLEQRPREAGRVWKAAVHPFRPERRLDPALARGEAPLARGLRGSRPDHHDEKQVIEDPAHIEELAREKRRAHELRGRDRLRPPARAPTGSSRRWRSAASISADRSPAC